MEEKMLDPDFLGDTQNLIRPGIENLIHDWVMNLFWKN